MGWSRENTFVAFQWRDGNEAWGCVMGAVLVTWLPGILLLPNMTSTTFSLHVLMV